MIYRYSERQSTPVRAQKAGTPDFNKLEIVPKKDLLGAGKLLSQITLPPGALVAEHAHNDEYEVYLIVAGEGTYHDNGTAVKVSVGDTTLCRSGEKHSLVNTGNTDLTFIAFIGFPNPDKM
ncbi:MAG: cupin domain-containing protein [Candidatus Fimivivens sp.]